MSDRPESQPTIPAPAEYLTAGQVAGLLQVSEKSVYRWAAADPTLPALRIGGTVRFPRERLLRWLRNREQGPGRQLTRGQVRPRRKPAPAMHAAGPRAAMG